MPGREPWERYSGDEIEAVVAIMLLREHPHGRRIRPSQGDGGVDVLVPRGPGSWDVYQIKKFTTALSGSHKRQIDKSWKRLREFTGERGIEVTAWYVVRPVDPTHEDNEWLAELTADSGVPSSWIGLTTIDGWAARYPDVIDYYLHGGRDHVTAQVRDLLTAAQVDQSLESGRLVEPLRALDGLRSWRNALNSSDPHYRYEMATMPAPREGEFTLPPELPGLVFSVMVGDSRDAARLDVFTRYDEAVQDRPLPVVRFSPRPGTEVQHGAFQDFLAYGIPFDRMPAQVSITGLPGGEDIADVTTGEVSLRQAGNRTQPVELVVSRPSGQPEAVLQLRMSTPTRGSDESGRWAWRGTDVTGVVSFELRHDPAGAASVKLHVGDFSGHRPRDVVAALEPLLAMRAGTAPHLRIPDGPTLYLFGALPDDAVDVQWCAARLQLAEDLVTLQSRIPQQILIPDLAELTAQRARQWREAATLLRGRGLWKSWTSLGMVRHSAEQIVMPHPLRVTRPLEVQVEERRWPVGLVDQCVIAARWNSVDDQGLDGMLHPGEDDRMHVMLASDDQAQQRSDSGLVQIAIPDTPAGNALKVLFS